SSRPSIGRRFDAVCPADVHPAQTGSARQAGDGPRASVRSRRRSAPRDRCDSVAPSPHTVRGGGRFSILLQEFLMTVHSCIRNVFHDNLWGGLALLWHARDCAQDAHASLWDFALEIDKLYEAGLTITDLRWLVVKGFVERGAETSASGDAHR